MPLAPRFVWLLLFLPVAVFLLLRLAILFTALDRLGHLGEGELAHAELAADLADSGRTLRPLWHYQVVEFHGGTLVATLLFVPWSRVFGLSYASLKGLALAFAAAAMLLWMRLLWRRRGWRAALVFGWLYALAPPVLTRMQLTLWATHAETSALLALCLLLADRVLEASPPGRLRRLFALGLAAGFALFFNYSAAVLLALLLPAVVWGAITGVSHLGPVASPAGGGEARILEPQASALLPLVAGFAFGLAPLLATILLGQGQLEVYGQGPPALLEGAIPRLLHFPSYLLQVPPLSPQMPPGTPGELGALEALLHLLLYGVAAALAGKAVAAVLSRRSEAAASNVGATQADTSITSPVLPLVIGTYPWVFLLVYCAVHLPFSSTTAVTFGFEPRYAATMYPFLFAGLAWWAAAPGARAVRTAAVAAALLVALPGGVGDLELIDASTPDMARRFEAIHFYRSGILGVDRRSLEGVERFLALEAAGQVSEDVARGVRAVLGEAWYTDYWRFLWRPKDGPDPFAVDARVEAALELPDTTPDYRRGVAWGRQIALGEPPPDPVPSPWPTEPAPSSAN